MATMMVKRLFGYLIGLPHIVKFGMVGGTGALLKIGMMFIFTGVVGVHYLVSYAIVFCMTVVSNFTLNSLFTFQGVLNPKAIKKGLMAYSGIAAITLTINEIVVFTSTHVLGNHYLLGTVAAVLVAFIFNFTMSKKYVWVT